MVFHFFSGHVHDDIAACSEQLFDKDIKALHLIPSLVASPTLLKVTSSSRRGISSGVASPERAWPVVTCVHGLSLCWLGDSIRTRVVQ